ncbi:heterokaryon incompatibility protein-domain-containing protein [Sordaria brevicollis]|uniref:Heterokaryon incompatibility protein-domain-containing protein n=1 Tax=Sordaria brevicollis TaxID=83679 RepID=A0AAE0NV92_SORBR|nr:heterokaryon incompatibility protein-domain-containing protein [Sordaria brevicollis]
MADSPPQSEGLCLQCIEIMNSIGNKNKKSLSVRSWRTLQLYCNVAGGYEEVTGINPASWPPRDAWKVTADLSQDCPLCVFFADCALAIGIKQQALVSGEKALFARLIPYSFTIGLPTSFSFWSKERTSITDTRVLELIKDDGDRSCRSSSADYGPSSWPETHLVILTQTSGGQDQISDTVDHQIVSEWLSYCQSTHDSCTTTHSVPFHTIIPGLHLIDCDNGSIIPAETMATSRYVTLSYVWGSGPVDLETMESSTAAPVLPDTSRLPRVISDAMEVVRRLGYKYLWVDRYCIPQGNSRVKHLQIQSMGKIYSLSDLTIVAAAGDNAEYGLPGVSCPPHVPQLWTTVARGDLRQSLIYFQPPNNAIGHSVWASRGWTYQEALLSRRRLVFTDRNVFFQCQSVETVGPAPYPDPGRPGRFSMPDPVFPPVVKTRTGNSDAWPLSIWGRISDFVKRTLSYEEDTLNAMQGIFGVWRESHAMWFLYGLPVLQQDDFELDMDPPGTYCFPPRRYDARCNALLHGLLWRDIWDRVSPGASHRPERPRRVLFPSWTWAGWRSTNRPLSVWSSGELNSRVFMTPNFEPLRVAFSFRHETLDWVKHKQEILRRSDASYFPTYIVLRGAQVFDATITCKTEVDWGRQSFDWDFSSPPFLENMQRHHVGDKSMQSAQIPPGLFEKVEGGHQRLVALPLFTGPESYRYSLHILVMQQVAEDDDGPIFERVTCFTLWRKYFMADIWPPKFELREMEVRLR